jgi:hypothetical protein
MMPFFVGLLYLNQNLTCLRNLEFNMHGSGHYHHLQDGCEAFIVQTIVVGSLWTQSFKESSKFLFSMTFILRSSFADLVR